MKRVIVTGASGFIGGHTIPALCGSGFEVHVIGRTAPPIPGISFHQADIFDFEKLSRIFSALKASHLLHLAWYTEPKLYWNSSLNFRWSAASLTLIRLFHNAGGRRVVGIGTCAEYTWGPPILLENSQCNPITQYGAAKDITRRLTQEYANNRNLSFAWGRIFYLYGPGEQRGRLISDAIAQIREGKRFLASTGYQRRDFSYVADVGQALATLIASDVTGPVNIGSGTAPTVRSILKVLGGLMDRSDLIDFGDSQSTFFEIPTICADVSKLNADVGFASKYSLEDGLRLTLEATS